MEPLNKKERTSFIIKFSTSFIVGILIVLIPFYFMLRLPVYENALMTKELREMRILMQKQRDVYAVTIDSVMRTVAKYDLANQDIEILNARLATLISKMEEPFSNDTTWSGRMYNNIANSFLDLKKTKNDIIQSDNDLKDCQQELERLKEEAKAKVEPPASQDTKGRSKKKK